MTNARQVKPIFKIIKNRFPFFREINSRLLIVTPARHICGGIFIERCSDPDCFWPRIVLTPLFFSRLIGDIAMGAYFQGLDRQNTPKEGFWLWSDPRVVAEMIAVIETVAVPKLKFQGTLEGYSILPSEGRMPTHEPPEDRMLVHIALGNLDGARNIWHEQTPLYRDRTYHPSPKLQWWLRQLEAVAEPLFADDRPALARILHAWEAANVRGTELEPYWEPTPFPLER